MRLLLFGDDTSMYIYIDVIRYMTLDVSEKGAIDILFGDFSSSKGILGYFSAVLFQLFSELYHSRLTEQGTQHVS